MSVSIGLGSIYPKITSNVGFGFCPGSVVTKGAEDKTRAYAAAVAWSKGAV